MENTKNNVHGAKIRYDKNISYDVVNKDDRRDNASYLWNQFSATGKVEDYLHFCRQKETKNKENRGCGSGK